MKNSTKSDASSGTREKCQQVSTLQREQAIPDPNVTPTAPVALLSCSHLFHLHCIEALERYTAGTTGTGGEAARSSAVHESLVYGGHSEHSAHSGTGSGWRESNESSTASASGELRVDHPMLASRPALGASRSSRCPVCPVCRRHYLKRTHI